MPADIIQPQDRLRALYALWGSRRNGHRIPLRSQFQPEDFAPWMGNIIIAGVEQNPRRYRLRLVGTEIVEYDGTDYTGRYMDQILDEPIRSIIIKQYDACVDARDAIAYRYRTVNSREIETGIDKIFLPLSHDGETVSQVLVCLYASFLSPCSVHRSRLQDYEIDGKTLVLSPEML